VLYGPHGAPDFFTDADIETFFATGWEVHYNSSRTGVRLIGPRPEWARKDGGEAGLHPSNLHDNAYAIGAVDFTGDMPVILGPDGPSLGGFVCPATIVQAELWKLGQLRPGDTVRFKRLSQAQAECMEAAQDAAIATCLPPFEKGGQDAAIATCSPPFEKGGQGGFNASLPATPAEIPPSPPFSKGGTTNSPSRCCIASPKPTTPSLSSTAAPATNTCSSNTARWCSTSTCASVCMR
jgi:hypothetical protein